MLASPRSVSPLAASFIACLCQGILTHALSSLTMKYTLPAGLLPVSQAYPDAPYGHRSLPALSFSTTQLYVYVVVQLSASRCLSLPLACASHSTGT